MYLKSIEWLGDRIRIIDQTLLPEKLVYKDLKSLDDVIEAIKSMRVRGAPLLGVMGALGLALIAVKLRDKRRGEIINELKVAGKKLKMARPTAVNLSWGVNEVLEAVNKSTDPIKAAIDTAVKIMNEDIEVNRKIADVGQEIINDGDIILTHCNTGSLATVSIGTALGIIIHAYKLGKKIHVYFTETRPLLQGSRLTAFELMKAGVPATLICDTAVGHVLQVKGINKIIVGADRILADGTTYNKIGTFQIAVLAKEMGIPFYVAAPTSTFDLKSTEKDVIIEERSHDEVKYIHGKLIAPKEIKVYNPAFDKTPGRYITAFITEKGVIYPPYEENIKKVLLRDK